VYLSSPKHRCDAVIEELLVKVDKGLKKAHVVRRRCADKGEALAQPLLETMQKAQAVAHEAVGKDDAERAAHVVEAVKELIAQFFPGARRGFCAHILYAGGVYENASRKTQKHQH
jgi:predicted NodU family carbamoyl transferase